MAVLLPLSRSALLLFWAVVLILCFVFCFHRLPYMGVLTILLLLSVMALFVGLDVDQVLLLLFHLLFDVFGDHSSCSLCSDCLLGCWLLILPWPGRGRF